MKKDTLTDFVILICVFLIASCFPINLFFGENEFICNVSLAVLQIVFFIFTYFYLKKVNTIQVRKNNLNIKNALLFIPLLLVCGSNFLYLVFVPEDYQSFSINLVLISRIALYVFVAINEEVIFRLILLSNYEEKNRLKKILICAAIFGLFHISRFLSTFNFIDLIQIVYTFALGIVLCFIYEYGGNILLSIIFHFVFNIVNDVLFICFNKGISNYFLYIVANVVVAAIGGIYLLLVYLFVLKKKDMQSLKQ